MKQLIEENVTSFSYSTNYKNKQQNKIIIFYVILVEKNAISYFPNIYTCKESIITTKNFNFEILKY